MTRHTWTHEEARAALAAMPRSGAIPEAVWQTMRPASLAAAVFRGAPERLEGIAKLLLGLTTGSEDERQAAMWFLHGALHDEARAMRLAVAAVEDRENGFIIEPKPARPAKRRPIPKRSRS